MSESALSKKLPFNMLWALFVKEWQELADQLIVVAAEEQALQPAPAPVVIPPDEEDFPGMVF